MPAPSSARSAVSERSSSPEDDWRPDLSTLRSRLDAIDDQIQDLLIQRATVIESVARSGKAAAFRPGREASILRRLLGRHQGRLPPQTLVRMWREMLAGTTAMQTDVRIAVAGPPVAGVALAREHFGFLARVDTFPDVAAALAAVRRGDATVAVLPFPTARQDWWNLLTNITPRLHVVARLPFWADRPETVPAADLLVVATAPPDPSGADRSFLSSPDCADAAAWATIGIRPIAMHGRIAETEGLLTGGDAAVPPGVTVLGSYAIPVRGAEP